MSEWARFCEINYIPKTYEQARFSNLTIHQARGKQFLQQKIPSLLLHGECGTGKTYYMLALIRTLLDCANFPLWYVKFSKAKNLSDEIEQAYKQYGFTKSVIERCLEAPYLFIDDFGVQGRTERMERDFYEICDVRLADQRPTVFSTNLTDEGIVEIFGARIHSRLKQCLRLEFKGKDLRGTHEE